MEQSMGLSVTTQNAIIKKADVDRYQLVLFNRTGSVLVMRSSDDNGYSLPIMGVPRFTRLAEELTTLLRSRWSVETVLLFAGVSTDSQKEHLYAVLEVQDGKCPAMKSAAWLSVQQALQFLGETQGALILKSAYGKAARRQSGSTVGPFSKLGWLQDLHDWASHVINPLGMKLKHFQQLNGSETFSLIRFETTKQPVWFKAVGKPNVHEYVIAQALAQLLPRYVPNVLAAKPEWHAWLMSNAEGVTLWEAQSSTTCQTAAKTLADLQFESLGMTNVLLDANCRDLRAPALLEQVDPFFDTVAKLMRQQTKIPPPILTCHELADLRATLKDALHCLVATQIPDSLGHSDFNPANIIVGPEGCVFLDWAEAHVGHPFLTFEYLIAHLHKSDPTRPKFENEMRSTYREPWACATSPEQVDEAFACSPLVAVFAYAVTSNLWRDPVGVKIPGVAGHFRSLTRRMKQEADSIRLRRVSWLN